MTNFNYLSFSECKNHDEYLINNGYSMELLINLAGKLLSKWISTNIRTKKIVGIIGQGNNGKDVISMFNSLSKNYKCYTYCVDKTVKNTTEYKNLITTKDIVELKHLDDVPTDGVIFDGIYGTGLNRKLSQNIQRIISMLNNMKNTIISIDVPSGLTESKSETCIKADVTLTMMFPKKIFLNPKNRKVCGKIFIMNFKLSKLHLGPYQFPKTDADYIQLNEVNN